MCERRGLVVAAMLAASVIGSWPARGEDEFLAGLSKLATREARKQLAGKRLKFAAGPLDGHVQAIDPERMLSAEVLGFQLANDLLEVRLVAKGRFRVDGQVDGKNDLDLVADVRIDGVADVRFSKEGQQYFVEPRILDLKLELNVIEVLPTDLAGSEELLSNLAVAAFGKYKAQIIADINKRLGKRPF
jgi:hypothetical protein